VTLFKSNSNKSWCNPALAKPSQNPIVSRARGALVGIILNVVVDQWSECMHDVKPREMADTKMLLQTNVRLAGAFIDLTT
jgi:hypothetical protein